jgi:hypothetical protein
MQALMRVFGFSSLAVSVATLASVLVPRLRATCNLRWHRGPWRSGCGPVVGSTSIAGFSVCFGALGAVFAFGDWLVPHEYLVWFAAVWLGGFLLIIIGSQLDKWAWEQEGGKREEQDSQGAGPAGQ